MSEPEQTYTCPHHKVEIKGIKRETFQKEFYNALMWVDMMTSMRLYKDVKVSCHCLENYTLFDTILNEVKGPSTDVSRALLAEPMAPEASLASPITSEATLVEPMAPKDPKLTTK